MEIAFAGRQRYSSLYVLRGEELDECRPRRAGLSLGKDCVRYRRAGQVEHGGPPVHARHGRPCHRPALRELLRRNGSRAG